MYIWKEYSYSFEMKKWIVSVFTWKNNDILNEIHDNSSTINDIDRTINIHQMKPTKYSILPFDIDDVLTTKWLNKKIEVSTMVEESDNKISEQDQYYYDNLP